MKSSKHPGEKFDGNKYVFERNFMDLLHVAKNIALLLVFSGL